MIDGSLFAKNLRDAGCKREFSVKTGISKFLLFMQSEKTLW